MEDQTQLQERLAAVFRNYADILAVYLFGSYASGKANRDSDLDLAIVPRRKEIRSLKLDILTDLVRAGFCDVDLLFLDVKDIVVRYEAVRLNKVIYQAEDFERGAYYSRVVREYLDFLPYLKVQRDAYVARNAGGG